MIFEPEQTVYFIDQFHDALDLVLDLLRCHEDMCIILSKAAHAHQSVELS